MRIYIERVWKRAKLPLAVSLGPVQLLMSLRRAVRVSDNRKRERLHSASLLAGTLKADGRDACQNRLAACEHKAVATDVAVIVGAGPGFGYGVANRLVDAGLRVALVSRNAEQHDPLVAKLRARNPWVRAYGCDATLERSVVELLQCVTADLGAPTLVVYAVQEGGRSRILDTEVAAFEHAWRANCLGAFVVTKHFARCMVARGRGTVVLVGATSGLLGRASYINFAPGKFGLRAVSQIAARELGPLGIHVAHLIIDADIDESGESELSRPTMRGTDIAELVYDIHRQPNSAWTQELDARPFDERFWEHC